jgi:type I restriction enzyme S subunit
VTKIVTTHYPISLSTLPSSWKSTTVGEVTFDIQPGFASGVHNQEGRGIPHLRPMNVDREGRLDLTVVKYVSAANPLRVQFGDVLFNNTNSAELIGKTAHIGVEADLAFSNHMTRLRPVLGIDPRFMAYQLHFLWMTGYFQHRCTHHVNQASVSSTSLAESVPFLVAPSNEQIRIANEIEQQFTRLEAAVGGLKRVQANLKRYRTVVFKAAYEGRLVPTQAELYRRGKDACETVSVLLERTLAERRSRWNAAQTNGRKTKYKDGPQLDTSVLPALPEGWVWASLGSIAELKGGLTKGQKRKSTDILREVPYLRVANVQRGFIDLDEVKTIEATEGEIKELCLENGDVLFNEGGDRDKLGRGWVWEGKIAECLHQNHVFRARLVGDVMKPKLLSWYGNSIGRQYFEDEGKQTTNLASLNMTKLSMLPVPIPPVAEQDRIVAELERRLSVVDQVDAAVHANLKRAERLRQAVLLSAFEGKLVLQDPSDEPASALLERVHAAREAAPKASLSRGRWKKEAQHVS